MGKIAIVGCEASGKTVFMSAMADHYCRDVAGSLSLVPENADANRFVEFQRRQMRGLRQWPPATNPGRTVEMKWTLRRDGRTVADVGMLEFGGETFRAAFREAVAPDAARAAVKDLMAYLATAETVIVLVSIKDLLRDPAGRSAEDFERDTEAVWVTRGILDFVRRDLPHAALVIGLTQADRYRAELESAGGAKALFAARWPSVSAAADVPVVAVASVSATDEEGLPAPDYTTDGILPIMNEVFRQLASRRRRAGLRRALFLLALFGAVAFAAFNIDFSALFPKERIDVTPFDRRPAVATDTADVAATNAVATNAVAAVPPVAPEDPLQTLSNRVLQVQNGEVAGMRRLADRYYAGADGLPRDLVKARGCYAASAAQGDVRAQVAYAVMCERGEGGASDLAEALEWFARAAEGGSPDAMYRMGVAAWERRGAETNALDEARTWFTRAKASGCRIGNLDKWIKRVGDR